MKPPRRIVHPEAAPGARLALEPGDVRHLASVLRLEPGAPLEVIDGRGGAYRALYRGRQTPQVEVLDRISSAAGTPASGELPAPLTVLLGCLKGPRMDWAVEKLSELGVRRLVPLRLLRVNALPRLDRLRRIARESAKQCGRSALLEVVEPATLDELGPHLEGAACRLLLAPAGPALDGARFTPASGAVVIAVGPEGGLAPGEAERLAVLGFAPVRLGPLVLRAETAAIAAAAAVIALRER